jgi:hypothetical protein
MPKRKLGDSEEQQAPKETSKKRKIKEKTKDKPAKQKEKQPPSLVVSIPKSQVSVPKRSRGLSITSNTVRTTNGTPPQFPPGSLSSAYINQPSFPDGTRSLKFKNKNFQSSGANVGRKRVWKNLKQIIAQIKADSYKPSDPTYVSIEAPPSLLPTKKYSDISGLPAKYTDPLTGLYYSSVQEFSFLRSLPPNIVQSYLSLRKAGHAIV